PLSMIYSLKDVEFFSYSNWQILADSTYGSYNPAQGFFILVEFLLNALLIAYSVFLAFLFFKRRTNVPDLMTAFYIFNFVFVTGDSLLATQFGVEFDLEAYKSSFKALLGVLIWVPYFRISERSKGTFT